MAVKNMGEIIGKRELLSLSEWRSTQVGMWAWLMQRFSALGIVLFICLHLCYPYQIIFQTCLLISAAIHIVLGIRVIFLDIGTRVALQKILFGSLIALGIILFVIVFKWRIYY